MLATACEESPGKNDERDLGQIADSQTDSDSAAHDQALDRAPTPDAREEAGTNVEAGTDVAPSDDSASTDTSADVGTPSSFVPDIMNMTFEGMTLGEDAGKDTAFPISRPRYSYGSYNDGRLRWEIADSQVKSGTRSMQLNIVDQIDSETNSVGGTITDNPPYDLVEGDEIWWRASIYLPADFSPSTIRSSPVKWFRIYRVNPDDTSSINRGALEFKLEGDGKYRFGNEFGTEFHTITPPDEDKWKPGWNTFEAYAKFSSSSSSGRVRFWRNNSLIYDLPVVTLPQGAKKVSRLQFIAYWNCVRRPSSTGSPQCPGLTDAIADQLPKGQLPIYIDDMLCTGSRSVPQRKDADGNTFIGGSF